MKQIKLLFMDVDGTLTDGKLYIGVAGEIFKAFSVKDGCGIHDILPQYGVIPVIITARNSEIVQRRCEELKITEIYQGCRNKRQKMIDVAAKYGIKPDEKGTLLYTAYIGDDILDLQCMEIAQITGCPADAVLEVKQNVDFVSRFDGGNGAVREFIEWLVKER